MSMFLYLLGKSDQGPPIVFEDQHQNRKRLQKPRGIKCGKKDLRPLPCSDIFDVVRAQSCLTVMSENLPASPHHNMTEPPPHIGYLDARLSNQSTQSYSTNLPKRQSTYPSISSNPSSPSDSACTSYSSNPSSPNESLFSPSSPSSPNLSHPSQDSLVHYPGDEMAKRMPRRAKTPILFVGQLEEKRKSQSDPSRMFAQEYLDVLPPRSFTPSIEDEVFKPRRKSLRKIKCQHSLRDLVKEHKSRPLSSSDCETLVGSGSESPDSPSSPVKSAFPEVEKLQLVEKPPQSPSSTVQKKEPTETINDLHDEIGLGICMDLLTNELATALFKQHPSENQDRASGLQVLLMIEAYETLQQHVRKEIHDAAVAGQEVDDHVRNMEAILDRWLESLYAIYESSEKRSSCEIIKEEEEDWPLRRSEDSGDSGRTYVSC